MQLITVVEQDRLQIYNLDLSFFLFLEIKLIMWLS